MERVGLLHKAKNRRYHLEVRADDAGERAFSIVADVPMEAKGGLLARARSRRGHDVPTSALPTPSDTSPTRATARAAADSDADSDDDVRAEIERMVAGRTVSSDALVFGPGEGRVGLRLPIVVNAVVILLVAVTLYVVTVLFNTRVDEIAVAYDQAFDLERSVVDELIRSSQEEIASIEEELSRLERSRRELEANLETRVAEREAQLRERLTADLAAELAAERERLRAQGTSEAEITQRIEAIETARQQELQSQLIAARSQLEIEFQQRVSDLETQSAELASQLATERAASVEEIERARAQAGDAQEQLRSLQDRQELVNLFQDQLAGSYQAVIRSIQASDYGAARAALSHLEELYAAPSFSGVEEIQNRREIDTRLIGTVRNLIAQEERLVAASSTGVDDAPEGALGDALQRVRAQQELLDEQRRRIASLQREIAERGGATDILRRDLETIIAQRDQTIVELEEEIRTTRATGTATRETLEAELSALRVERVGRTARIRELNEELTDLQGERTIQRERIAVLESEVTVLRRANEAQSVEITALANRIASLNRRAIDPQVLTAYRTQLRPTLGTTDGVDGPATITELLETKLLLLRVARLPEVRERYPGLYDQAERFFDKVVVTERTAAAGATLAAVREILLELTGVNGIEAGEPPTIPPLPGDEARVRAHLDELLGALPTD